ncbi:UDP-N-acetylmuramoyl-L-alanyl-D-glutamate--2,6-diaminopimelate ligase [Virgibacillus sp. NKC19-16]|uniref:UDP-N-acetylmuramoyl-L-alanyl-D-glutamate--2, 6-diaminopimelate ligase n=1 Tax=Virgibacillus salidurans TaxID=2831673 RepID=UPI001F39B992|nr:UDP-N-acetylmuramoyl-L-alanyl-D-glutamate--2,6-diaminopimelate ligase [Virgibacillus sp. NKC19-16]UJL44914.1 UDP-N-acetylmuramoyl-L-alanyl-D-glutamate--2,6-diaminopimelate ligase [Virgibacillus sp. NKC19-16]
MITTELLSSLRLKNIYGTLPSEIASIHHDSRKVENDTLFICLRGYTVDGHDYYSDAIKNGATVILAEEKLDIEFDKAALVVVHDTYKAMALLANKFYNYPSLKMSMFGVTGTNGKTTVTNLIKAMLQRDNQKTALSSTIGLELENELVPSNNTTSDCLTNQQTIRKALDHDASNMVMEVSSHGLSQGRLWGVDFDIVTFTNLTQDHLDYHKTMEEYGYVKGLLFAQLGNDLTKEKYVVLNSDDPWSDVYNSHTPVEVITYSIVKEAHFKAEAIKYYQDRTQFTLHSPEGTFAVELKLVGEFNVYNALAAIASLFAKGMSVAYLVNLIKDLNPINGRMEKLDLHAPVSMYLDYAHTPDAIEKSIASVLPFKQNRLIFVIGTGGDRDKSKRPLMAEKASAADYVILTVNDPRYEDSQRILTDMEKGMLHDNYTLISDRKEAISHAITMSEPGDILVFAGKGQEQSQIIKDKKHPHSDVKIAEAESLLKYK